MILKEKFQYVFDALETSENCRKEKLTKEFDASYQELIVLGFNSSSYDLNLIKPKLIKHIYEKIDFVTKKANNYQCLNFAFFWLFFKGNQYEFLTHPKIKGLDGGLEPPTLIFGCVRNSY